MEKKRELDLLKESRKHLKQHFQEQLTYLKSYVELCYKPLVFTFSFGEEESENLQVLLKLSGKTRKLELGFVVDVNANPMYNFDIVKKYTEEFRRTIKDMIIQEGIKSL
jgi:3'-phosphoadenosine 5'-phosphosulfate sulfotransferase (PAPS reductase)/FAD synthetase